MVPNVWHGKSMYVHHGQDSIYNESVNYTLKVKQGTTQKHDILV